MPILLFLALFLLLPPLRAEEYPPVSDRAFSLLPKKELNISRLGINSFVNDSRFGSIKGQFREVNATLGIKYVRVLFAWNDQVQPSPTIAPNFSFYDEIARSIPRGVQALVIVTGVPTWMNNSNNWIDQNPRKTFIEHWVKKVATRYKSNRKIKAFQVWNEPNMTANPDNILLDMSANPENYVEMLRDGYLAIKAVAPGKKVVSAATTAINQNYPETIDYNHAMYDAGAEQFLDIWGVHYYGSHIENVLRPGGVKDFTEKLSKPVWITESGEMGVSKQQEYARRYWPFLLDLMPSIKRIYIYQFTESTPASSTYGLKNLTAGFYVSDLYIYLRDRYKNKRGKKLR